MSLQPCSPEQSGGHEPRPCQAPARRHRRRYHGARLHVFGSVLRPDSRPGESDIDLLVEFQSLDASSLYRAYFALLNDLQQDLASHVDLVMADAVRNPYIWQTIEASRQEIFAA